MTTRDKKKETCDECGEEFDPATAKNWWPPTFEEYMRVIKSDRFKAMLEKEGIEFRYDEKTNKVLMRRLPR